MSEARKYSFYKSFFSFLFFSSLSNLKLKKKKKKSHFSRGRSPLPPPPLGPAPILRPRFAAQPRNHNPLLLPPRPRRPTRACRRPAPLPLPCQAMETSASARRTHHDVHVAGHVGARLPRRAGHV